MVKLTDAEGIRKRVFKMLDDWLEHTTHTKAEYLENQLKQKMLADWVLEDLVYRCRGHGIEPPTREIVEKIVFEYLKEDL